MRASLRFDRWHPLAAAADNMPDRPGVFQLRLAEGLVDYPRGRSAMVGYGSAPSLRRAVAAVAAAREGAPWLCRCTRDPVDDPPAALARLVADFRDRFGEAPRPPHENSDEPAG
jgi:hypothetical protein